MIVVNPNGGEILDLTPLRTKPRKSSPKRRPALTRQDVWFIKHISYVTVLVLILMGLLASQ